MMPITADHKPHLLFLAEQPVQVLQDFCKLVIDYLQKGPNLKLYTAAAQKLEVDAKVIQNSVEGLVHLLIECTKNKLPLEEFQKLTLDVGFTDDKQSLLSSLYTEKELELQQALSQIGFAIPQYHNLEWRFEVQIASRSLLHQVVPSLVMDFTLKNPNKSSAEEHVVLQSDPRNLLHLTQELEAAIQEGRSQHIRKIKRIIK
ncbi:COMM domain-containing protein 2 [Fopius arisanus]|uniref:COMM domain-containing protein 2 n=1 Tax=Fopius arisanus TaxID=64838 RepID=A0A9R1TLJ2_9HYME|nr:PREDICTED: COMM domain-containing protein 2 [Fopius arisanus]